MRNTTREELIELYRDQGEEVPDMVKEAKPGTEFIYGFHAGYRATVALHQANEKPTHVYCGLCVFPILPGAPGTIELSKR